MISVGIAFSLFRGSNDYDITYITGSEQIDSNNDPDINDDDIVDLGFISYDMPIRFMFYLKKDIDINNIKVQDEEVECVTYMSVDEIKELIKNKLITESHGIIFNKILEYKEKLL